LFNGGQRGGSPEPGEAVMSESVSVLYYPMLVMFVWTFAVMLRNVQVRVRSVLKAELTNEYFELFENGNPSETVTKTSNHLRNLFEFPVLFYSVLLLAAVLELANGYLIALAWIYVGLRIAHSLVHLTFNKVPARFLFYISSNIVLLALWVLVGAST
jgi:hypothetical protein